MTEQAPTLDAPQVRDLRVRHEGHGLASAPVREALTATVAAGQRIVPVCAYVQRWTQTHDDVAGQVDQPRPEHPRFLEERGRGRRQG